MTASFSWSHALPTFSVVMPVHNPSLDDLRRAIESVANQVWPHVELCLVDDASTDSAVVSYLKETAKRSGVQYRRLSRNEGIASATNAALEMASGDFVVFVDHDDELDPEAFTSIARTLRKDPSLDFVYSDHDIVDDSGRPLQILYKPDWSPELLLAYMYVGHIKVVRRALAEALGGFREGFDGAADYDFMLRVAERTDRIRRIPEILYHWRAAETSMALRADTKTHAFESGRRAVAEALERRGIDAVAQWPTWAQRSRVGVYRARFAHTDSPRVTLLIPTRDRLDLLEACIASIEERTDYSNWEILILDNDSREESTRRYFESSPHRVLEVPGEFNFSKIVNRGVDAATGEFVVLLNNDTLVVSRDWLTEMVGSCEIEGVGAVGAKLLFPDGRIQHAGVTLGVHGLTGHAFEGSQDRYVGMETGYFAHVPRNVSAVTAACLMVRRSVYLEVGGFDEGDLAVAWNDVDFCLRLREAGLRIVMNPLAELIHLGSASRGDSKNDREVAVMFDRWAAEIADDPYYSPNYSRLSNGFELRTQLDEARHFHYSPSGFLADPASNSVASYRHADGGGLTNAALKAISENQAFLMERQQTEFANLARAEKALRILGSIPLLRRVWRSQRLRSLARRVRDVSRRPAVRRVLSRLRLAP